MEQHCTQGYKQEEEYLEEDSIVVALGIAGAEALALGIAGAKALALDNRLGAGTGAAYLGADAEVGADIPVDGHCTELVEVGIGIGQLVVGCKQQWDGY